MTPLKLSGRSRHDDVDLERDRSLVERCQAGDERAFEDLYLRYRDRLFRFCLRRTSNASEAEDLVQEAFARAWKALPTFSGERRFYPWLSVIANNLCTDLARRGRRCSPVEETSLDLLIPAVDSEQEALVERQGDGAMLEAALGRLSARHREVLELREGRNWSYQEIASHSGVEVSTIETLLFRARRSLKREYMTIAKAEAGLAGGIAIPLAGLRGLFGKLKHLVRPAGGLPAKLAAAASQVSVGSVVGGVAVAATAAAVTVGAVVDTHPHGTSPVVTHTQPASTATVNHARQTSSAPFGLGSRAVAGSRSTTDKQGSSASSSSPRTSSSAAPGGTTGVTNGKGGLSSAASAGNGLGKKVNKTVKTATNGLGKVLGGSGSPVSGVTKKVGTTVTTVVNGTSSTVSSIAGAASGATGGSGNPVGTVPLP